ncbi:MAG: hypothetical protein GXP35_05180 [Actinobacteria bacterium]|nr:hypothetical protein [Actinomycetota bacterium]
MSVLWFGPAIALVIGAIAIAKQVAVVGSLAVETESALAEAGEVLSIVSVEQGDFDAVLGRLGVAAGLVGGPWRATSTSARLMRRWWGQGRPLQPAADDVPLLP